MHLHTTNVSEIGQQFLGPDLLPFLNTGANRGLQNISLVLLCLHEILCGGAI